MRAYLYRGSYTPNAWREFLANPRDIGEVLGESIRVFGGTPIACFVLNAREPIGFVEFPDEISASAWNLHLLAQDGIQAAELIPLRSTAEFMSSMSRAAQVGEGGGEW